MEQLPILRELVVVTGVGVVAALVLRKVNLPAVAGLLLAGAVVGPQGLGIVSDLHAIEMLAEVGVIFLLFTIGLEFSLTRLRRIARLVAVGGTLQVGLTMAVTSGISLAAGTSLSRAILFGFLAALSSTAIVLRGLSERGELDAPHGRVIVGAMIFQDLCVVPMMLIVPILGGSEGSRAVTAVLLAIGKAALLVAVTMVLARLIVPRLFRWVDETRSREIFLLAVLVVCVGTAYLTSLVGLSLALGAFLAGVVLADSDFGHRALSDMLPLRDVFTSLFFMSLGMLFDARVLAQQPGLVAAIVFGLLFGKGLIATLSALAMRFPLRIGVLVGAGLAQFGEFGFVLAKAGVEAGLMTQGESRVLLSAGVLTMFVTPLAMRSAPHFAAGAARLQRLSRLLGAEDISARVPGHAQLSGHVVVVGYGLAGRSLCRALKDSHVPYLVLELNAEVVGQARATGESIYYGDVTSQEALEHARAGHANALVLLINDPDGGRRAVAAARRFAPGLPIFIRTRYLADRAALLELGATEVVCEEVEAGLEVLTRVLRRLGLARNLVVDRLREARTQTLSSARDATFPRRRLDEAPELAALKIESLRLGPASHALGRTLRELELRGRTGVLAVALSRAGSLVDAFATVPLAEGDLLFLVGPGEALRAAEDLLVLGPVAGSAAS